MAAFKGWWRQRSRKAKIWLIVGAVVAVFVIIAAVSPSGDTGDGGGTNPPAAAPQPEPEPEPEPEPPPPPPPPPSIRDQVTEAVHDKLGDDGPDDLPRIRSLQCARRACTVAYNADIPFSRPEREMMAAQRGVFDKLLNDLNLRSATLIAWGEVTSIGGKESRKPVMRITCNQAANAQIDWEDVTHDGMKLLCDYTPFIDF